MLQIALTIAGSDSGGGAGIQADLKTFLSLGVFGTSALTAITAQNTLGVSAVHPVPIDVVKAQIHAVLTDLPPAAIKIGMLATAELVLAVVEALADYTGPVVLDPVMVATSGDVLLAPDAVGALRDALAPRCALITPNLPELHVLGGEAFLVQARVPVLVKGGHDEGPEVLDTLYVPGEAPQIWRHPRLNTRNTHGTGCTLSAAIAARLALGDPLDAAVAFALQHLAQLIAASADHGLGAGHGPLLHGLTGPRTSSP
ncbi:MAG: bifunctional hydroxymethylpyrimidine kinase/phosphomethylpyrimidine kinase [Deltaproteobacteria bacterium]|nr:bifunctional hydroxymethylpyrimidine kinase/phosphomethylpyrimidine kinase [Deltaproteobacteria bacterium]